MRGIAPLAPLALGLGACIVQSEPAEPPPPAAPLSVAAGHDPLEAFAGIYVLGGAPVADGCGGRIVLAARAISVDLATRTLFADVVDRSYPARVEAGHLVAEGRFPARAACPETVIYERWTLARSAGGGLEGVLQSLWMLPPACSTPCQVQFRIVAARR